MKIAIVYDDVVSRADASPDERGVLEAVDAVARALDGTDSVALVPVARGGGWIARLEGDRPDIVFNLCEGVAGSSAAEVHVAGAVALLGIPMTGSGAETLALARRKDRMNAVLEAAGVTVPQWAVAQNGTRPAWRSFPAIVKPVAEDGSVGIGQHSVVRDAAALAAALDRRNGQPCLVQRFVNGREFNVPFVGNAALPIAEIDFTALPAGLWPVVGYDAKWLPGSLEDEGTRPVCPAPIDADLAKRLFRTARVAWSAAGGRGYARVDVRLGEDGCVHVLDVNPNPDLAPGAGLARAAAAAGWTYTELVRRIIEDALAS